MKKTSVGEFSPEYPPPFPQKETTASRLFEAMAEGNMHCYCLLELTNDDSMNQDFLVRYANSKLIGLLRLPRKSVVGSPLSSIYPFSKNWVQCGRYFDALQQNKAIMEEFPLEIFEQTRWYRHEIVPLSENLLSVTAEDVTEQKSLQKQLVRKAFCDDLTGLKNRNALVQFLNSILAENTRVSLILFDIEGFSDINNSFGVDAANNLLRSFAKELQGLQAGSCYRLSADTFGLLVQRQDTEASVNQTQVVKWSVILARGHEYQGKNLTCVLSVGYSNAEPNYKSGFTQLLGEAEVALSAARQAFQTNVVQYSGSVMQSHRLRLDIGRRLPQALASKEFKPFFQPQYSLRTGAVLGFELLCRWSPAEIGFVSPEVFISIAEQMHLLKTLDLELLESAVSCIRKLPAEVGLCLSVNASPASIQDSNYLDSLLELSCSLPNWCNLEVEITENSLISDSQCLKQALIRLQRQGVSIALDDFGSGYSNFGYLASFPFEKLKLDRTLIASINGDTGNGDTGADLVSGVINLAHKLGLQVVAEGIESQFQLDWLRSEGCEIGQGYYLCKPLPQTEKQQLVAQLPSSMLSNPRI